MGCREIPPLNEFFNKYKEAIVYPAVMAVAVSALVFGPSNPDAVLYITLAAVFAPAAAWLTAKASCALASWAARRRAVRERQAA